MKDPYKRRYFYLMLSIFGAVSLSILVFFVVYRFQGIGDAVDALGKVMAPFIYGGVVAYLLRPMCNLYRNEIEQRLPRRCKRLANSLAVGLSLITGILIVYALIIMIAPQLFNSIRSLWDTLPDKVNQFLSYPVFRAGFLGRQYADALSYQHCQRRWLQRVQDPDVPV